MKERFHFNLLRYNTFGIEAYADHFVEYESDDDAEAVARQLEKPYLLLGGGSDLLLTGDYHGTVVHSLITDITTTPREKDILVRVGSGKTWDSVVELAVCAGWHGAENLSVIPGEVGASAVQNIGAYGAEVKDLIDTVEAVEIGTGKHVTFANADCGYAYRQSRFKHEWRDRYLITHVTYRFSYDFQPRLDYGNIRQALQEQGIDKPSAVQLRETIKQIRDAKLPNPKHLGNAGSFFMNPIVSQATSERLAAAYPDMPHYPLSDGRVKLSAGWMIQECGWKGKTLGRAGVYEKQALILVNRGGAEGSEIVRLMRLVQADVKRKFDIDILPEVNIV